MNDGQTYTFDMDTKQCDKSVNSVQPFTCIPASATYISSSTYGYRDKQIIADTWRVKINETINFSTVSRGDCVPLTDNVFIQSFKLVDTVTTTDFVARIDDPSIFDIPS